MTHNWKSIRSSGGEYTVAGTGIHVPERAKSLPAPRQRPFQPAAGRRNVWLLGIFYFLPWVNVGSHQAVLFDLPARRFYILGLTFWPQDFIYLATLMISAGLSLFFFTALAGRLWCGYACPQTVWTEAFLMMERWVEGNRQQRMKLDSGPWNRNKILRKVSKQSLWSLFPCGPDLLSWASLPRFASLPRES